MNRPKIKCVYLDMDGVIADFEKRYKELYHMAPREAEKHKKFDKFFDEFIATQQFASLDLMPGSEEGLEYLRKANVLTQMLTSSASEKRHDDISRQKMLWLEKHGITFYPIIVPGKRLKQNYAGPDCILIDDTEINITQWTAKGGIGILHKDWHTTMAILHMYI
jgi:beta-phosphoglucomutase-like phosphatase (HAD superfamily)